MNTLELLVLAIKNIAEVCSSILIVFITMIFVGFVIYQKYKFCRKHEQWEADKHKDINKKPKVAFSWECLLINGAWGIGKTTYYENNYQYIDDKPNIYISCFSASRSELIAQIIQQQFWCKLLTLNGLLAKFMENNWQIFMPKNRVVVFDDLERLHAGQENYLDLIGVIDYLKITNKCKMIMIADISKTLNILFNTYMERIVDETEFPTLMPKTEFGNRLIKEANELTKKLLNKLYGDYERGKINNLRIIKNIMPKIAKQLEKDYSEFNEYEQVLNGSYSEIIKLIHKHYLFYIDNALFKDCSDLNNGKIFYKHTQDDRNKYNADLQAKLNQFNLNHEDFKCTEYKTFRDIQKILEPDFGDFLMLNINANLKLDNFMSDDGIRIKNLVIQYLEKYLSNKTKNNFESSNYYILWLLYILWNAKYVGYREIFERVLFSRQFFDQLNYIPKITDEGGLLSYISHEQHERYMKLFKIEKLEHRIKKDFLTAYYSYYRNKIIDKFINSIEQIDYNTLYSCAETWFKNNNSDVDYDFIDERTRVSALDVVYSLMNQYINLVVIQKWIDNRVRKNVLTEYYITALNTLKDTISDIQEPYIQSHINELTNIGNRRDDSDEYLKLLCEKYDSFEKMQDKLFKFKNMVAEYITDDKIALEKFNQYNNDNIEIIYQLFVAKNKGKTTMDKN